MRLIKKGWGMWSLLVLLAAGAFAGSAHAQQLPLGTPMPLADQTLTSAGGGTSSLAGVKGAKGTVVVFWSNQCPWIDKLQDRLFALSNEFKSQGVGFVLVNANDAAAFPKEAAGAAAYPVPYLVDADAQLAKAFGAERTPHIYVFDARNTLVYAGALDDSPGDAANVQKQYLRDALTALAGGQTIGLPETPAFGCTIKLKP